MSNGMRTQVFERTQLLFQRLHFARIFWELLSQACIKRHYMQRCLPASARSGGRSERSEAAPRPPRRLAI